MPQKELKRQLSGVSDSFLSGWRDEGTAKRARNGVVLCALHHRAFDAGLFAIEPTTLKIHFASPTVNASRLHITNLSLEHLAKKPHVDALEWQWTRWKRD